MFNRKNAGRLALGVALTVVGWGLLTWLLSPPRLPLQKPGTVERLQRMPPDTKEETRRYLYVDGKDRRMEVVFSDGCFGIRQTDENGTITHLAERKKDGSSLFYAVDAKLQVKRIVAVDKKGKLFSVDTVLGTDAYKREWYWPDGKTLRAVLEVSSAREVFTVYDEKGGKRFEDLEVPTDEDEDPESGYYGYGGRQKTLNTISVYNGNPTPAYTQTVGSPQYNPYYGGGQMQLTVESIDVYEPGTTIVARRITPKSNTQVGSKYETLTKVEVFSNGEVRYVRYLDAQNRIVKMVEKRSDGDVTTEVTDLSTAAVEPLDAAMFEIAETPADLKLAEAMIAGNTDMHLQRLLVP